MGEIRYLAAADKFISSLEARHRARILADIELISRLGFRAPVSVRTITGHSPMWEVKNGDYRTFFFIDDGVMWILHACKKQDQRHGITAAAERMKALRGR